MEQNVNEYVAAMKRRNSQMMDGCAILMLAGRREGGGAVSVM
jgi:hypothetical protein